MKHLGDITQISGRTAPVVDCIIGGSPCQDLSIAGKRAGLAGERSGLFMEQIRIIKEMREQSERTTGVPRPRFAVWENVPGALSSHKNEDFRIVLEEFCKIAEKTASVPRPPKGKWGGVGCIVGDGFSIAWRILDAQFWGVPQRRRRIALVADFGGYTAPEILFERESMFGDPETGGETRQRTTSGVKKSFDSTICLQGNGIDRSDNAGCCGKGWAYDVCCTLNTVDRHAVAYSFDSLASNSMKSNNPYSGCRQVDICKTLDATRPDPSKNQGGIAILDARGNGNGEIALTLTGDHENRVIDYTTILYSKQSCSEFKQSEVASTCTAHLGTEFSDIVARPVRRLTPLECERLQGYPDGWTDIGDWTDSKGKKRKTSDSARYKALGNSIALPPWKWVLKRLCAQYERDATMASLFDGIGGFPLIWEQINGKGSCMWSSEIEEFPMAVTKIRFGG